ncbi:uncharacterized protein LOC122502303 [Leptopilina heterotoma]|uniref:uncharacterized protein LOC122502303 n=1 Tax=Leptopilina heterotoma TaxID=63436 RepID=UPI001CA7FF19|nr:uncharacterized protein LOC122502303 [Leptopilina heterotoma]
MVKYNHGFPIAYALMENKSELAYVSVLGEIRRILPELEITSAMSDFEVALQNSVLYHFPNSQVRRCYFHFVKAIYLKGMKLGLRRYFMQNDEGKHTLRQIMALALLPYEEINPTYNELKNSKSAACRRRLREFFNYFERQWLRRVRPEGFSVYGFQDRTNNVLESYHKTLLTVFGKKPSIWNFTKKLGEFQQGLLLDFASLSKGNRVTRPQKKIILMRNEYIIHQWRNLQQDNRPTALEFLENIINFNTDPFNEYVAIFEL